MEERKEQIITPYKFKEVKLSRSCRSSGDGQETSLKDTKKRETTLKGTDAKHDVNLSSLSNHKNLLSISEVALKLNKASLFTVPDPQLLNSPPIEIEQATKILLHPTVVSQSQTQLYSSQSVSSSRQRKEPKFVPYEPYKGCVKSIEGHRKRTVELKQHIAVGSQPKLNSSTTLVPTESIDKLKCIIGDFESEKLKWEKEISSLNNANHSMKEDLKASQKEMSQLKQQLSIQSQVNSELKKLLVASMGEDVQGRVQCLTEDKARMATMIRKYSEKVDRDFEEKERISIQCDVWRSKFLAGSLLVDELARWKGTLMQRCQRVEEAVRVLLQETEVSRSALISAYKHMRQIQDAFDPLKCELGSLNALESTDALSLSVNISGLAEALRDRLLGDMGRAVGAPDLHFPQETKTPGEKMAIQILDSKLDLSKAFWTDPSSSSKSTLCRYHPHTTAEKLTMNCCANCDGEIFVV